MQDLLFGSSCQSHNNLFLALYRGAAWCRFSWEALFFWAPYVVISYRVGSYDLM